MYNSVADACNDIVANQSPVLFVDTCSILNIINSVHMHSLPEKYALSARELISMHGSDVWLVTSQNVKEEWDDNIDMVLANLEKEVTKVDRNISSMLAVMNVLLNAAYDIPQKLSDTGIKLHVRALSESFLNTCLSLKREDEYTIRAMDRVRRNLAPAARGKQEAKDCEIVECFLDLGGKLRDLGFGDRLIFFTTNKKDFGSSRDIKPPLDTQFSAVGADLINNIDHVLAIANGHAR